MGKPTQALPKGGMFRYLVGDEKDSESKNVNYNIVNN